MYCRTHTSCWLKTGGLLFSSRTLTMTVQELFSPAEGVRYDSWSLHHDTITTVTFNNQQHGMQWTIAPVTYNASFVTVPPDHLSKMTHLTYRAVTVHKHMKLMCLWLKYPFKIYLATIWYKYQQVHLDCDSLFLLSLFGPGAKPWALYAPYDDLPYTLTLTS